MLPVAYSFIQSLNANNYRFTHNEAQDGRKEHIRISFNGDHGNTISQNFIFDPDGTSVNIVAFSICKVSSDKMMDMFVLLNEFNSNYRWLKFYIDDDNEVTVSADAVIEPVTAGDELSEIMHRFNRIIDEVYPRLMKICWG